LVGGLTLSLAFMALAAWGVTLALAAAGLAVGFWVRDPVRGLLTAMAVWFAMLFGTDLLLLAVSGAPWIHERPGLWVALLMGNPLDAFRITVLFSVEQAAFAGLDAGGLAFAFERLGGSLTPASASDWLGLGNSVWRFIVRPIAVGSMMVGTCYTLFKMRKNLIAAGLELQEAIVVALGRLLAAEQRDHGGPEARGRGESAAGVAAGHHPMQPACFEVAPVV
jgi:hypothetical protein